MVGPGRALANRRGRDRGGVRRRAVVRPERNQLRRRAALRPFEDGPDGLRDDVEAAEAALPERRDGVSIRVEYGDESEWDRGFAVDTTPASETPDESTNESDESSATDADGTPGFGVLGTLLGAGVTTALVARLRDDGGE